MVDQLLRDFSMIYKTFTKELEKMKHSKEQIDAAIEYLIRVKAQEPSISIENTRFFKIILAALEQYKQQPASNTEALEALDRILMSYKLMLNDIELGTPKNEDGSKTLPPWLRDCRNDLKLSETIRTALTNPPANTVDVEALKVKVNGEDDTHRQSFDAGWNDCIDHLVEKGIINAE